MFRVSLSAQEFGNTVKKGASFVPQPNIKGSIFAAGAGAALGSTISLFMNDMSKVGQSQMVQPTVGTEPSPAEIQAALNRADAVLSRTRSFIDLNNQIIQAAKDGTLGTSKIIPMEDI